MHILRPNPIPEDDREAKVISMWRSSGILWSSVCTYSDWVRRFRRYCRSRGLDEVEQATLAGTEAFLSSYRGSRLRRRRARTSSGKVARNAIHAWSCALRSLGEPVPKWKPLPLGPRLPKVISIYSEFRKTHRGVAPGTLVRDSRVALDFLAQLQRAGRNIPTIRVADIDDFIDKMSKKIWLFRRIYG